jgi:hypothetical protein
MALSSGRSHLVDALLVDALLVDALLARTKYAEWIVWIQNDSNMTALPVLLRFVPMFPFDHSSQVASDLAEIQAMLPLLATNKTASGTSRQLARRKTESMLSMIEHQE